MGMLIDTDLLRFCAKKTREIEAEYEKAYPEDAAVFWRSTDGLDQIMMGRCAFPIYQRELKREWNDPKLKVRSLYVPYADRCEIYYARNLPTDHLRYYKTKELLQAGELLLAVAAPLQTDPAALNRRDLVRAAAVGANRAIRPYDPL